MKTYDFYDKIEKRIESDLNMLDIVKKIRYMQVMLNSTHFNSEVKRYKVGHTYHNVIDLEETENAYPKQHKTGRVELLSHEDQDRGRADENIDHQILNRGVPLCSHE
jgi:hypothetical protein